MKSEKKIKRMVFKGFGFPILLFNVPAKVIRGNLEAIINYRHLGATVIKMLCLKATPLTGHQLRFIRHYLELPLRDFAELFGLSHPAVLKWEKRGDDFAEISPVTEKMIRLEALFRLGLSAKEFHKAFTDLKDLASELRNSDVDHEEPLKLAI
jgi:DNA-binding transcriptional regulator YiaG